MLNRLGALSPPRIGALLMSVHINLCVTTAEELWISKTGTAGTSTTPLFSPCTHRGERCCSAGNGCTILRHLHWYTDCHLCGRKTIISQNICSLSIYQHLIKSTLSSQDKSEGLTMSVSDHQIYWCSEQVREPISQTFIHKEQTDMETSSTTGLGKRHRLYL